MKTFLICPVRGHELEETEEIVKSLEEVYEVYWPPRDTNQDDPDGFNICLDNRRAIMDADVVHLVYDGTSQGSHFDLGMAFAYGKPIIPLGLPPLTDHKSFQNMISLWRHAW